MANELKARLEAFRFQFSIIALQGTFEDIEKIFKDMQKMIYTVEDASFGNFFVESLTLLHSQGYKLFETWKKASYHDDPKKRREELNNFCRDAAAAIPNL